MRRLIKDLVIEVLVRILKLARRIRPFQFVYLYDERFGHLLGNTELYLRKRRERRDRTIPIFLTQRPCNIAYIDFLARHHLVIRNQRLIEFMSDYRLRNRFATNELLPPLYTCLGDSHQEPITDEPALRFSPADHAVGQRLLETMGIGEKDWYVCLHVRDAAYLTQYHREIGQASLGDPHSYRNCHFENYLPAACFIASTGGHVIRMGSIVEEPLVSSELMLVDYATEFRTEFGDFYLPAHCLFFLGSSSGCEMPALVFNRPRATANWISISSMPRGTRDLMIPMRIWSKEGRRFLKFHEMLDTKVSGLNSIDEFNSAGLETVENEPEEIVELVDEMLARIKGTWMETEQDRELQERLRSLYKPLNPGYGYRSRMGAWFLRRNQDLLK